jgi:hypothetical protein
MLYNDIVYHYFLYSLEESDANNGLDICPLDDAVIFLFRVYKTPEFFLTTSRDTKYYPKYSIGMGCIDGIIIWVWKR